MTKASLVLYKSMESGIGTIFGIIRTHEGSVPSVLLNIQTFLAGPLNVGEFYVIFISYFIVFGGELVNLI